MRYALQWPCERDSVATSPLSLAPAALTTVSSQCVFGKRVFTCNRVKHRTVQWPQKPETESLAFAATVDRKGSWVLLLGGGGVMGVRIPCGWPQRPWQGPVLSGIGSSLPTPARFAEEACALLTSSKFEACHHAVSPLPYLQNCRYDVCSCSDGRDCLCSAVANYAAACARKGVHVGWREPDFCGECPMTTYSPLGGPPKLWHLVGSTPPVLFKGTFFELFHLETGPSDKRGPAVHLQPFLRPAFCSWLVVGWVQA